MPIEILERKHIDSKCRTLEMHAEHRASFFHCLKEDSENLKEMTEAWSVVDADGIE